MFEFFVNQALVLPKKRHKIFIDAWHFNKGYLAANNILSKAIIYFGAKAPLMV